MKGAMIGVVVALLLVQEGPPEPSWRRGEGESCGAYLARLAEHEHKIWKEQWCKRVSGDLCNRRASAKGMRTYWVERWHGCSYLDPEPVDPLIFSDDFESGGLEGWSNVVGSG